MPSILTHYFFANDVLKEAGLSFLKQNSDLFCVASQGPDVLFYAGLNLWHPQLKLAKYFLGSKMHKEFIYETFLTMFLELNYVEKENKEICSSFVFGFLSHYLLDSTAHPFVYYYSGITSKNGRLSGKTKFYHSRLESLIDYQFYNKRNVSRKESFDEALKCDKRKLLIASSFFARCVRQIFDNVPLKEKSYYDSVLNYKRIMKAILKCPRSALYKLNLKNNIFFSLNIPKKLEEKEKEIDFLNLTHQKWYHPSTKHRETSSFVELYDEALKKCCETFKMIIKAKSRHDLSKILKIVIDEKNYYGSNKSQPMVLSESIFDD